MRNPPFLTYKMREKDALESIKIGLGRVGWPSMNPRLHQSELKMEAAGTNVALHLSSHFSKAGWSPQFSFACLM